MLDFRRPPDFIHQEPESRYDAAPDASSSSSFAESAEKNQPLAGEEALKNLGCRVGGFVKFVQSFLASDPKDSPNQRD